MVYVVAWVGVVVGMSGALSQGLWGSGGEAAGVVKRFADDPAQEITPRALNVGSRGMIVVGGTAGEKTLLVAARYQVHGMVLGSLDASLRDLAMAQPYPLVVTEGFGSIPMNQAAFDLLADLDGHDASISGEMVQRWGRMHPEIVISRKKVSGPSSFSGGPWQPGDRVHLVGEPYAGEIGEIGELLPSGQVVPTGRRLSGCRVALASGETVFVPWTNLERIRS